MSKAVEPVKCIAIEMDDVRTYTNALAQTDVTTSPHSVTTLPMLRSELTTDGLSALHKALASNSSQIELSIEELKAKYTEGLLKDLEELSKRKDFQDFKLKKVKEQIKRQRATLQNTSQRTQEEPTIEDIRQELAKEPTFEDIREELKEGTLQSRKFLQFYADLISTPPSRDNLTVTECISAKMLLKLYPEQGQMTTTELRKNLQEQLDSFAKQRQKQTEMDLTRDPILLKGPDGKAKIITYDQLLNDKSILLTEEQRGFIKTAWMQGSFGSGWFTKCSETLILDAIQKNKTSLSMGQNLLQIDLSQPGQVSVYSRWHFALCDLADPTDWTKLTDGVQGTLRVDISALQGNSYTPGCASEKPKITAYISEFDPATKYDLPQGLDVSSNIAFDVTRNIVMQDAEKACLDEILQQGKNTETAVQRFIYQKGEEEVTRLILTKEIEQCDAMPLTVLINQKGQEQAARLILEKVVNSDDLKVAEKVEILNNINKAHYNNFFDDAIKTMGAEVKAREKMGTLLTHDNKFKEIRDYIYPLNYGVGHVMKVVKTPLAPAIDVSTIPEDVREQRLAVEYYMRVEEDPEKRKKFAAQQLDQYCAAQTTNVLDKEEKRRLQHGITSILEPLCRDNPRAREGLEQNVGMVIREYGKKADVKMSFGVWWKANVTDPIKRFFGRGSEVKQLMDAHPEIATALQKAMPQKRQRDEQALTVQPPRKQRTSSLGYNTLPPH